jgi:uncharacterized iron-regulated membrane protein
MLNRYVRRLHRWLTLVFAFPLVAVVATGLVLSFEPIIQQTSPAQPITLSAVESALLRFDPQRTARNLAIRTSDNTLIIGGVGAGGSVVVDLRTGEEAERPSMRSALGLDWRQLFLTIRRMHESLLLDLGWLVTASTIAMLIIACLGLMMGWPRWRSSLSGWHQGAAWLTLPLVILSPLSGLAMAFGITFMPPLARSSDGARIAIADAVRSIAADHDLANLVSIGQRGRILMARIYVDGELRGYRVGAAGLERLPRNWPRVIHEGNWGGVLGSSANIVTSVVLLGLLATGLTIWSRRSIRKLNARTVARGLEQRAIS